MVDLIKLSGETSALIYCGGKNMPLDVATQFLIERESRCYRPEEYHPEMSAEIMRHALRYSNDIEAAGAREYIARMAHLRVQFYNLFDTQGSA